MQLREKLSTQCLVYERLIRRNAAFGSLLFLSLAAGTSATSSSREHPVKLGRCSNCPPTRRAALALGSAVRDLLHKFQGVLALSSPRSLFLIVD